MNKDIKIMIELQRYWQKIITEEKSIERNNKSINYWTSEQKNKKNDYEKTLSDIKSIKALIKSNELKLDELDIKLKKLEERRISIIKEKELNAVDHEMIIVKSDRGEIEEKLIMDMDSLDEMEKSSKTLLSELENLQKQVSNDISEIQKKIKESEFIISQNKEKYNDLLKALSPQVISKFDKMLKSKNGIAVSEVINNVCSGCNFEIPASLAVDAAKSDLIKNCTNCGRFIYK